MASFLKVCPVRYGRCKMCMYTNKRDYYKRLFEQGLELSEDFFFDGSVRLEVVRLVHFFQSFFLVFVQGFGYVDADIYQQVACAVSVNAGQAFVAQAEDFARLGARFDFYFHSSVDGRDFHCPAQGCRGEAEQ